MGESQEAPETDAKPTPPLVRGRYRLRKCLASVLLLGAWLSSAILMNLDHLLGSSDWIVQAVLAAVWGFGIPFFGLGAIWRHRQVEPPLPAFVLTVSCWVVVGSAACAALFVAGFWVFRLLGWTGFRIR
jgi:hypothetical protein